MSDHIRHLDLRATVAPQPGTAPQLTRAPEQTPEPMACIEFEGVTIRFDHNWNPQIPADAPPETVAKIMQRLAPSQTNQIPQVADTEQQRRLDNIPESRQGLSPRNKRMLRKGAVALMMLTALDYIAAVGDTVGSLGDEQHRHGLYVNLSLHHPVVNPIPNVTSLSEGASKVLKVARFVGGIL